MQSPVFVYLTDSVDDGNDLSVCHPFAQVDNNMENRRQHYRHEFAPTRHIAVELRAEADRIKLLGSLINLSISGMCVYALSMRKDLSNRWVATLPLAVAPLTLEAERVYVRDADRACCGFRFVDEADAGAAEEREKAIWKFLLDEQRRRRRFLHGE